ncbi:cytochrome c [Fluviicoccus keumensis]|uniref:Cytochrome c n=1 Tax=Fluviicoccus keumensis TaxID=1435465 RepID=A0A4Q7ZCL7_9GAMM|nr:c-type cytochrome [Fluviicoccus keumensis]RZU47891.1 cytochrome c [Fluviicoccus keumensis]
MQPPRFAPALPLVAACLTLIALQPAAALAKGNEIERGRHLAGIMGCADCHTPMKMGAKGPEPDLARGLSGHPQDQALPPPPAPSGPWIWGGSASMTAFYGPWGISYSANLTPDKDTGIGNWTLAQFSQAMKTGKHLGNGRPILPPMPWQAVSRLDDHDLKALFRFLMAQPAVKNTVPEFKPAPSRG